MKTSLYFTAFFLFIVLCSSYSLQAQTNGKLTGNYVTAAINSDAFTGVEFGYLYGSEIADHPIRYYARINNTVNILTTTIIKMRSTYESYHIFNNRTLFFLLSTCLCSRDQYYWAKGISGGIGLGMDHPVFYDVKDTGEGEYYAGGLISSQHRIAKEYAK